MTYSLTDVMVFETEAEVRDHGCRVRGGRMVTPDGRRAVTVHAHPHTFDGMRVTSYAMTERAADSPRAARLVETLRYNMAKTPRVQVDQLHIYVDTEIKHRWSYVACNGPILADSGQGYADLASARHGFSIINRVELPKMPLYRLDVGCDRHDGARCMVWEIRRGLPEMTP